MSAAAVRSPQSEVILQYLRKHGQRLDSEIAAATQLAPTLVRREIERLRDAGEVMACTVTRFEGNQAIQMIQCRLSGSVPVSSPGRKPTAKAA